MPSANYTSIGGTVGWEAQKALFSWQTVIPFPLIPTKMKSHRQLFRPDWGSSVWRTDGNRMNTTPNFTNAEPILYTIHNSTQTLPWEHLYSNVHKVDGCMYGHSALAGCASWCYTYLSVVGEEVL